MSSVGIFEAKNRLSELIERAALGEEIIITRRGEQVARLMPPEARNAKARAQELAAQIRLSRAGYALGTGVSLRKMVEDGRR